MELADLEVRLRNLCDRAVEEIENKATLTKETVQMLESINKMMSIFYERDKTKTVKGPFEDLSDSDLEAAFETEE